MPDFTFGSEESYSEHPTTAQLVLEISVTTVTEDRAMASIYAEAAVAEYWLFNAPARVVEVFRKPEGGHYQEIEVVTADQALRCSSLPGVELNLPDLWAGLPG